MERYNFKTVEEKWQKIWEKEKTFSTKLDKTKKKFYCLEMFPYPSGKIHISGGKCGNYDKSLSGKRIPEGSVLMEVEEIVLDFSVFTDYHTPDMNFLQWEEWSEIIKFAPISEVRDYIIAPMIKNNTSHDKWVNLME